MTALAAAHQCLTKSGMVPCGTVAWVVTSALAWAFGLVGLLVIVLTIWELITGRGRRR